MPHEHGRRNYDIISFVAVADAESLTVAAERKLHTSQRFVERADLVLEDEVGGPTPYVRRSRRRTDTGEALCKSWLRRRAH
jgi:DNA-binding transcriptional LysR family regulator